MSNNINEEQVKEALESGYGKSGALLNNKDELDDYLYRLEQKIKEMPLVGILVGEEFAVIPIMISLIKHYVEGKYTTVPYGTILAIMSALIYVLSPVDIIPDFIPFVGHLDDVAVIGLCLSMVKTDVEAYDEWRRSQGLI